MPGILYGGSHDEPVAFTVGHHEFRLLLNQGATLFDVQIGGEKSVPVIIKDQQLHPVRDETLHVDLLEVRLDEKIHAEVTHRARRRRGSARCGCRRRSRPADP